MIRYTLKCAEGHRFDGWFPSSAAFAAEAEAGRLSCALCGSTGVEKALMAPAVPAKAGQKRPLAPSDPREKALSSLRHKIETSSDYVGADFAAEARRIHDGESERRAVWGEATREEAKQLHKDGIPALPIPWMARRND